MKIATWNINGVSGADSDNLAALAASEASPTSSACRRSNAQDDAVPARSRSRRSAIMSRRTARRASTASPSCRKLPFDEVTRGLPGDDGDEQARFIEGVFSTAKRRARVASHLSAQRQSDRHREVRLQAGLDGAARSSWAREPACRSRSRWCWPATTTSFPSRIDAAIPEDWVNDALFQPQTRARFRAACSISASPMPCAPSPTRPRLHVLGLSGRRLAEEQRHPHRPSAAVAGGRRPACRGVGSTSMCAAWEKPSDHVPVAIELRF